MQYEDYCKNLKVPKDAMKDSENEKKYDNSILYFLGLTPKDLKTKNYKQKLILKEKNYTMNQQKSIRKSVKLSLRQLNLTDIQLY